MIRTENTTAILVQQAWREYALPRFADQGTRGKRAWDDFVTKTHLRYREMQQRAQRGCWSLDYRVDDLRLLVLKALPCPCTHCNRLFGIDSWAVSYIVALCRGEVREFHLLRNLVVTCERCALGRGDLAVPVWIDILAALNAETDDIAGQFLDRLVQSSPRQGSKVLPAGTGLRVTREPRQNASAREKN